MFRSQVSLCHLCLAIAPDSSLTFFCWNTSSTSSRVLLLVALMLRNVCNASFLKFAWKLLISIASFLSGCFLSVLWKKGSNSWNFSVLSSNNNVIVDAGFNIADVVSCCWGAIPAIASANLLIEVLWSLDAHLCLFSSIGNVVSCESCLIMCCGFVGSRWVWICPQRNLGILCAAFCLVTMGWMCFCRPRFLSFTKN